MTDETLGLLPAKEVKLGTFVKRTMNAKRIYLMGSYDRSIRAYVLHAEDDISVSINVKPTALLFVGFTF